MSSFCRTGVEPLGVDDVWNRWIAAEHDSRMSDTRSAPTNPCVRSASFCTSAGVSVCGIGWSMISIISFLPTASGIPIHELRPSGGTHQFQSRDQIFPAAATLDRSHLADS